MKTLTLCLAMVGSLWLSLVGYAYSGDLPAQAIPLSGIRMDGDLDDWPEEIPTYPIAWVWPGAAQPKDGADFAGAFQIGYDKEGLYVAVVLTDDTFANYGRNWNEQDRCELYLTREYGVRPVAQLWMAGGDGPNVAFDSPGRWAGVHGAFSCDEGRAIYEWFIPAETAPRMLIGFDIAIDDKDEDGSFSWIGWRPGAVKYASPERIGRVLLVEAFDADITSKMGIVSGTAFLKGAIPPPVRIAALREGRLVGSTLTDDGRYAIYLFPGTYRITASNGFEADAADVKVSAGAEVSDVNLTVRRGPRVPPVAFQAGGGGGPVPQWFFGNFDDLNERVAEMGLPTFDRGMFLMGGKGYGRVRNFFFGGGGAGGSTEASDVIQGSVRSVRVEFGYGGAVLGLSQRRPKWEASVGVLIGGGSIKIIRTRNARIPPSWEDAWKLYRRDYMQDIPVGEINVRSELKAGFLALEPFGELKYWPVPWAALDLSVGYLRAKVGAGKWEQDEVKVPGSPEIDFSGPSVKLGIHFGI